MLLIFAIYVAIGIVMAIPVSANLVHWLKYTEAYREPLMVLTAIVYYIFTVVSWPITLLVLALTPKN